MKKILVSVLISLISLTLFAFESQTRYVQIKGYYEESEAELIFKVWKENIIEDSGRIYHAGDLYNSNIVVDSGT